jgi:hypothetical protein
MREGSGLYFRTLQKEAAKHSLEALTLFLRRMKLTKRLQEVDILAE